MKHGAHKLSLLHWPLIVTVVLVALLGVYNLNSAAAARDPGLYLTQALWMTVAMVATAAFVLIDYRVLTTAAYPIYTIVVTLLLAVLSQGRVAKGASRWLELGPLSFQPSELAKLGVVLCLARYFSTRMLAGGYTITALARPLNLSRPLGALLALIVFWNKPWLADPLGQLARFLFKVNPVLQPLDDLLWFRVVVILSVVALLVLSILTVIRYERRSSLLNPWPEKRKKRLITILVVLATLALGLLFWSWNEPLVRDPIGALVTYLVTKAAPGGVFAAPHPSLWLRIALLVLATIYLLAALLALRTGASRLLDLFVAPIDLALVPALLILVQPDLGTAGIVLLVSASMMLVIGLKLRSIAILAVVGVITATGVWTGGLRDYQKQRILTFLDPEQDTQGAGWNAVQSMIAVGSGRITGRGHKGGTQTQLSFLPEQHTDFAFSVWGEEQGFLGSSFLVTLYFAMTLMGLSIASLARDNFGSLLAMGATAIIFWQAIINMSMVVGIFPVVGITLPLFSYGGSSVVTIMAAFAILLNVHWRRR